MTKLAGEVLKLHTKHGVYLDRGGVANLPEDHEDRLTESKYVSKIKLDYRLESLLPPDGT